MRLARKALDAAVAAGPDATLKFALEALHAAITDEDPAIGTLCEGGSCAGKKNQWQVCPDRFMRAASDVMTEIDRAKARLAGGHE